MKRNQTPSFGFFPRIEVFRHDLSGLTFLFDSACEADTGRSATIARVPLNFAKLQIKVEGFADPQDTGPLRRINGEIKLLYGANNEEVSSVLASIKLLLVSEGKPDPNGVWPQPDEHHVRHVIEQATSEAFSVAISQCLLAIEPESQAERYQPEPMPRHRIGSRSGKGTIVRETSSKRSNRPFWAAVACGPLVLAAFLLFGHYFKAEDSVANAVAQEMTTNPDSIMQQVQLVNSTLREMGLDPAAQGSDLGCLAPQQ